MAIVYSYIRFSSVVQKHGRSEARQLERGADWIMRHGHEAATTYPDLGVSGFRGRNKTSGALSRFLAHIQEGRVKPGSILLVEALDRLSRQGIDEAGDLFRRIIKSGVNIAVFQPYERLYDERTLSDPFALFEPLMAFHLAYLESENKSQRIKDAWAGKRKAGKIYNSKAQGWLTVVDGAYKLNIGAEAVVYIFRRTIEGCGQKQLTRELNEKFKPLGRSGQWNGSYVASILSDRSVLGEYQAHVMRNGKREPIGDVRPDYFPRVVSDEIWMAAQGAKARRVKLKGPSSKFVNLFTGMIFSSHDGSAMHLASSRKDGKVTRRLTSWSHLRGLPGSERLSVSVSQVETALLEVIQGLSVRAPDASSELVNVKTAQLVGLEKRLDEVKAAIGSGQGDFTFLLEAANKVNSEIAVVRDQLAALHNTTPLHEIKRGLELDRHTLRSLLNEVVEKIWLKPEKHYGRVWCSAWVVMRSGLVRLCCFGPRGGVSLVTDWPIEVTEASTAFYDALDDWAGFMHVEDASEALAAFCDPSLTLCESTARKLMGVDAEPVRVDVVPEGLKAAAEQWLAVRRAELAAQSYKVLPSKIVRFVDFLGDDLVCGQVNGKRWASWVRHLEGEVRGGKLAQNTAYVCFDRSREFVRFLVAGGVCLAFDFGENGLRRT